MDQATSVLGSQDIRQEMLKTSKKKPSYSFQHSQVWFYCYRAVCILGYKLQDSGQTGVTGTFPTQCHLDGEVLSV
jgi:hypothetical protein